MAIKIEITGENAKDVMAEMFNLCSGVFFRRLPESAICG